MSKFTVRGLTNSGLVRNLPTKADSMDTAKRNAKEFFHRDGSNRADSVYRIEIVDSSGVVVGGYDITMLWGES